MSVVVPSHDVRAGDVVHYLGDAHLIVNVVERPSVLSDTGRIRVAVDGRGWGITIDGVVCGHRIATPTEVTRSAA